MPMNIPAAVATAANAQMRPLCPCVASQLARIASMGPRLCSTTKNGVSKNPESRMTPGTTKKKSDADLHGDTDDERREGRTRTTTGALENNIPNEGVPPARWRGRCA